MKQGTFITALVLAAGLATAAPAGAGDTGVSVGAAPSGGDAQASALQLNITGSPQADEISVALDGNGRLWVSLPSQRWPLS